jgi:hypothetical protein
MPCLKTILNCVIWFGEHSLVSWHFNNSNFSTRQTKVNFRSSGTQCWFKFIHVNFEKCNSKQDYLEKNQVLCHVLGHFVSIALWSKVKQLRIVLTLFLPAVVTWHSYMGWFPPWPVGIGLRPWFLKDITVAGGKLARNGQKNATLEGGWEGSYQ